MEAGDTRRDLDVLFLGCCCCGNEAFWGGFQAFKLPANSQSNSFFFKNHKKLKFLTRFRTRYRTTWRFMQIFFSHGCTVTKPAPERSAVLRDNLSWHTHQSSSLKTGHARQRLCKARRWKSIALYTPCWELIPSALKPNSSHNQH